MVETVSVTGTIAGPGGVALSSGTVTFVLSGGDVDLVSEEVIHQETVSANIGADGTISTSLWPNSRGTYGTHYAVTIVGQTVAGDYAYRRRDISVPEAEAPHDLSALLALGAPELGTVILGAITQAQYNEVLAARDEALAAAAETATGMVLKETWTALQAVTPSIDGAGGTVLDSDTGSHSQATATGYDGATVDNAGRYSWNDSWSRWVRIGDGGLDNIGPILAGATEKTVLSDGDTVGLTDTDDSDNLKKTTVSTLREQLKPNDWRPETLGGQVPMIVDEDGVAIMAHDLNDDTFVLERPVVSRSRDHLTTGMVPTAMQEGRPVEGWRGGQKVVLHPLYAEQRLALMADVHGVQQLFLIAESEDLNTVWHRQVTYAQADVTGFDWVQLPTVDEPGVVQITRADQPYTKRRHMGGRVQVHVSAPAHAEPTTAIFAVILGQSQSVGAGSTNGITIGSQTIYPLMVRARETFEARCLRFNAGVLPHQDGVESSDRDTAIASGQLASFQSLKEGNNDNGEDRETFASALALHLNGPNGYDAGKFVLAGSFGFGGSSFTELILDGGVVQTSYQNALDAIQAAYDLFDAEGISMEVVVVYDQGEADANTPATTYRDYITGWHSDLETRVGAITGQGTVKLFLSQTIWTRGSQDEPCYSAYGQQLAAAADADIHLLPPSYFTDPDTDVVHHKATEHQWRGALYGEVMADVMMGRGDPGLIMSTATYTGDEITVTFNNAITIDHRTIIDLGDELGLSHQNSAGATRSINYSVKSGANELTIKLSADVPASASEVVRVASKYTTDANPSGIFGYAKGLRSPIRRPDWERYSMIDGRPLFIFANIQEIPASEV